MPMTAKSASGMSFGVSTKQIPAQKLKYARSHLWRRVLIQALKDASRGGARRRVAIGLWVHSPDFTQVCDRAGILSDNMRQGFKQVLLAHTEDRKSRSDRLCTIIETAASAINPEA